MRLARITGARGMGKTVLLNRLQREAEAQGWVCIAETAYEGLPARLRDHARTALAKLDMRPAPTRRVQSFTLPSMAGIGGGGISLEEVESPVAPDLRSRLEELLDTLETHETGCLITIDEVHGGKRSELRELFAVVQHLQREERQIAVLMAGLPAAVSDLLNDDVLTFLRRADPHELGEVDIDDVAFALRTSFHESDREISPEALRIASEATGGYPFMVQLVGYHTWRLANKGMADLAVAQKGALAASKRLGDTVHGPALNDLSAIDKTYLLMMAQDDGPSSTGIIASRMEVSAQYGNQYRQRLIDAGIIVSAGFGMVDFAIAGLREYIREHAASLKVQAGASEDDARLF